MDLILAQLGSNGIGANTSLWGTFGDWAQGILPAAALLSSVYMWIEDRKASDQAARNMMGDAVFLHSRSGRAILVNQGSYQIYVVIDSRNRCLPSGKSLPLDAATTAVAFTTAVGEGWVAELDKPARRA